VGCPDGRISVLLKKMKHVKNGMAHEDDDDNINKYTNCPTMYTPFI
jgi:hypothetical protein